MLAPTRSLRRKMLSKGQKFVWGAPGKPLLKLQRPEMGYGDSRGHQNIIATAEHHRSTKIRFYAYLGKHVPRPQKALWSPDTPVPQDQHSYKLTTLDIDQFKYWFGVKGARVDEELAKILHKAGLLPPTMKQFNPLAPRPIFKKEELYKYYLANRPPLERVEADAYTQYVSATDKVRPETKQADRPAAPWL
jgi:ribosomal protein S16